MNEIKISQNPISLDELECIARKKTKIYLSEQSKKGIYKSRGLVEKWVDEEKVIYGITTGFGAMSGISISKGDTGQLQKNLLMSHACGVGMPLDIEIVRSIIALRVKDFALGHTSIKLETVEALITLLNNDVIPVVPEKGSVGASGDLVPLAHIALVLIGMGEAWVNGKRIPGLEALKSCGLSPLDLGSAEGLSLINGTQAMTGIAVLNIQDAVRLAKLVDIAAAMSTEVLMGSRTEFDSRIQMIRPHPGQVVMGSRTEFDSRIQMIRPHPGQVASALNMEKITRNSEIISSHEDCSRVQDAYSMRCSPQVHGASKDAISYAKNAVEIEINSSTCNPLIFPEDKEFLLGGNFHGQPIALAMDFLGIGVSEIANISERRVERLVNPQLSGHPAFLVKDGGLNSGFMIAQYAAAALVSENKVLAHPASVDSIPTSANKEDHVSMGTIAARKAREIIKNVEAVIAVELLCGAQAMDLFTKKGSGEGTQEAYKTIREHINHLDKDRYMADDIEKMRTLMKNDGIINAVEKKVGKLTLK